MTTNAHDVIVVGLGPTGLTMATLLGRRGLNVLVLEREPEFYGMARAVYTDDEALRVFQTAGIADELHADMNIDSVVQWVRKDGSILAQFREDRRPMWWPITNFLYQPYLENKLEESLKIYPNVEVRRGREVLAFAQDDDGVSVTHAASTGSGYGKREAVTEVDNAETSRAAYLIGADGGRSVVRLSQNIEMTGKSYPERWLVVDLEAKEGVDAFRHLPYFDFVCDPDMPTVSCPQPGGHHRFEFSLKDDDDKDEFESDETVRRLMSQYIDPEEVVVIRKLVYTFNAVVADTWRNGRVLLAGDAAHMTPQFIGQGMNAGIRDSDNLSWKLHSVLRHGADPKILDTFESERRPHAKAMIDLSVFNKSLVSIKHPVQATGRDIALRSAMRTPGLGPWMRRMGMKPKPRFKKGAYLGLPRGLRGVEGTLPPQPEVRTYDGRLMRLDDTLGYGWSVVGFNVDPREALGADKHRWDGLGASYATLFEAGTRPMGQPGDGRRRSGLIDVEDTSGAFTAWLRKAGAKPGDLLVLRPDKFVFGLTSDTRLLTREVEKQLGLSAALVAV
ncbi:3-(3-hydroxy-phenyl)propionate hydroxylase [Marmoricola sp. OAE513]|uniref:bifunctional 3-(3-hydroxy-phenyl)propionate/3-hydroxycinnamic acid hydroxylase n=1 Tax=Marmoricola sp. OAE513 TaxID=2817894 RepID=UPI001AE2255E